MAYPAPRSGGYIQVAIGTITFDAPGSYQISTEGLQEKRALYLDRFDFGTFFGNVAFGLVGPALFMAGLVWGIVLFCTAKGLTGRWS